MLKYEAKQRKMDDIIDPVPCWLSLGFFCHRSPAYREQVNGLSIFSVYKFWLLVVFNYELAIGPTWQVLLVWPIVLVG